MKTIIISIIFGFLPSLAFAQASPPPSNGCNSPESQQFDFWVGEWEVFPSASPQTKIAESKIEKLYAGCAIRENWMPLRGGGGGSLNAYVPSAQKWRQTWADSSGSYVDFEGKFENGQMVLQGIWPQPQNLRQITRMTYSRQSDGSVRQFGQSSDDNGVSWQTSFDFIYRPKAATH